MTALHWRLQDFWVLSSSSGEIFQCFTQQTPQSNCFFPMNCCPGKVPDFGISHKFKEPRVMRPSVTHWLSVEPQVRLSCLALARKGLGL